MRAKPIYPAAIREATPTLIAELEAQGLTVRNPEAVVRAVVRTYKAVADELETKRTDGRISPLSRRIAALAIGQGFEFEGQSLAVIRQRFPTARQLMDPPNASARWRCESRPNGSVWIERLRDGSSYYRNPARNPKVRELASLRVGETIVSKTLLTTRGAGQMGSNTKVQARKLLNEPKADWTVKSFNGKVRLTRIT